MITYVRVRNVKAGKYQDAIKFLKKYKKFIKSELGVDANFGAEVGLVGTVVSMTSFESAQAWEDVLNKMRANDTYISLMDESFNYFEDEIIEHLVTDLPI